MVTVLGISALSFIVPRIQPYFYAVPPPGPVDISIHRIPSVGHIQPNIDIIIVPAKVDMRKRPAALQMHEIRHQVERAPLVQIPINLDRRCYLRTLEAEIEKAQAGYH